MHDVLNRKSTTSDQAKDWCMHFWRKTSQLRDMVLPYYSWFLHVQAREKVGDDPTSTEIGAADALGSIFHYLTCNRGECATVLPYFRTVR